MKGFIRFFKEIKRYFTKENLYLEHFAIGINSYINKEEDLHIVMLDYDFRDLTFVKNDLKDISKFFNLSISEIVETNQGFHVFFWYDHVPYSRLRMIIDYSRCDPMYKYIGRYYDYKTIRSCGKYRNLETRFMGQFKGNRKPTEGEKELGDLKRREYLMLRNSHRILDKRSLKENEKKERD